MPDASIIDRPLLERLERLALFWQRSFHGLVGGHRPSGFAGGGQEFLDHRHFHHGDDLRAVNWRAYMRLEKLFLKMFRLEPHIPVRLMLDTSASMAAGDPEKFDFARRLAAALCYVGLVRLETISIEPFADGLGERLTASGGRHRFAPVSRFLSNLKAEGKTDFLRVVREFSQRHTQGGLLIVISDFLDDQDCLKPLQYLANFGHELIVIQVWSDQDRTPPWDGEMDLVDSENGEVLAIELDREAREAYTQAFDQHAAAIRDLAMRNGGRYTGLPTSTPLEDALFGPVTQAGLVI
jgi:uncharacterized protein (DUF58 family)